MVVVPSCSHVKVDICSRRAACEKHRKNLYDDGVYHISRGS